MGFVSRDGDPRASARYVYPRSKSASFAGCGRRFFESGPRALLSLPAGVQGDHGGARGTCTARDGGEATGPAGVISPACTGFGGPLRQKLVASALPLSSFQQVLVRLRPRAIKVRGAAILSARPSRSPGYRRAGFARGSTSVLLEVPWCGTMHIYSAPPHLALTTLPVAPFRRPKRSHRDGDMRDRGCEFRRMNLPKLFGKAKRTSNRDSEGRQEGANEPRSAASWRRKRSVEKPSALFQTVSPRTRVNSPSQDALGWF